MKNTLPAWINNLYAGRVLTAVFLVFFMNYFTTAIQQPTKYNPPAATMAVIAPKGMPSYDSTVVLSALSRN